MVPLQGRGAVVDGLAGVVAQAVAGHTSVALLRGAAGAGKSWVLDQVVAGAPAPIQLLRAAGHPSEQQLPYAGLHQLLRPVTAGIAALPEPQRAAVTAALALDGGVGPQELFAAAAGVHTLITRLAESRPVLLVVDDVHWLDPSTARVLGFVARRLDADRVALLLAARTGQRSRHDADLELAATTVVKLTALGEAEARDLLAAAHPDLDASVVREVLRVAAGLPLALVEVPADLRDAQRRGAEPLTQPLPAGRTLERVYGARLAELDELAREALLLASLEELDGVQLTAALGQQGMGLDELEPAERLGLVRITEEGVRFAHPLVRSAVERSATEAARRRAHGVLAEVLTDAPDRRAWHLHALADGRDDHVARALAETAARADARGAPLAAGRALAAAGGRCTDDRTARDHRAAAAFAFLRGGDPTAALRLLDGLVEDAADPVQRALAERDRVLTRTWSEASLPDRVAVTVTAALAAPTAPELASELIMDLAFGTLVFGRPLEAAEVLHAARDGAPTRRDLRSRLLYDLVEVMAGDPDAGGAICAAWEDDLDDAALCDPRLPVAQAALMRCWLDDPAGAARLLERQRVALRRVGAVGTVGLVTGGLAAVHQRQGDWDAAVADFEAAERLCQATGLLAPLPHVHLRYAALLAHRGDRAGCEARLATAIAGAGRLPSVQHFAEVTRGSLALVEGRYEAAIEHLQAAGAMEASNGLGRPDGYSSRAADLVEALWRSRREQDAAAELARHAERASPSGRGTGWAEIARGHALLADVGDLDSAFAAAVARYRELDDPFGLARTQLCWGERLRRVRRKRDARQPLHAAAETFRRLGAQVWVDRADAELAACGERRQSRTGPTAALTPQELQVAVAVARGASNPEVAAALYLSRRTVEYHLSAVYRKLDVRDRHALAERLRPVVSEAG